MVVKKRSSLQQKKKKLFDLIPPVRGSEILFTRLHKMAMIKFELEELYCNLSLAD